MKNSIDYYVNEKTGTVVCILRQNPHIIERQLNKQLNDFGSYMRYEQKVNTLLKEEYKGKAQLRPGEVFDLEKGKHIARLRALRDRQNDIIKIYGEIYEVSKEVCDKIAQKFITLSLKKETMRVELHSLVNE